MTTRTPAALLVVCILALTTSRVFAADMPQHERDYLTIVEKARKDLAAIRDPDALKTIRVRLQIELHRLAGLTHDARGWVGVLKQVRTVEGGKRAIAVEIAPGITIATWDNPYIDESTGTLISPTSEAGRSIAMLSIEQPITFDAKLMGSVITNDETMIMAPRLIAQFQSILPANP